MRALNSSQVLRTLSSASSRPGSVSCLPELEDRAASIRLNDVEIDHSDRGP
jgi:hypothetical protein